MSNGKARSRYQAGLTHLGISVLIAVAVVGLVFLVWYPSPLAAAQGVNKLLLVLIGVDVMIGPLITTIIYVHGKKGLLFDLVVISALQAAALTYGVQAIYGGRPAYVVFNVDRFDVVAVQDVDARSAAKADVEFRPSPWRPKTLGAKAPTDPEARNQLLFTSLSGGADLPQLPEYFVPLDDMRQEMIQRLHPLGELRELNDIDAAAWQDFVGAFGKTESELGYLPMVANVRDGAVILDARSGEILGIRMLTPNFQSPHKRDAEPASAPAEVPESAPSEKKETASAST